MSDMEALDGPLKGKIYFGVPEHTKTIVDYYKTPYDFYCVTYERTDKGWKFVREAAQSLRGVAIDYSNCEHDDVWFSRDICYCGGMHYYCEDCGVMVDEHFESDESKSNNDEVSEILMSLHKEMIDYIKINNGDNAFTANVIVKAYLLGLRIGRNEKLG